MTFYRHTKCKNSVTPGISEYESRRLVETMWSRTHASNKTKKFAWYIEECSALAVSAACCTVFPSQMGKISATLQTKNGINALNSRHILLKSLDQGNITILRRSLWILLKPKASPVLPTSATNGTASPTLQSCKYYIHFYRRLDFSKCPQERNNFPSLHLQYKSNKSIRVDQAAVVARLQRFSFFSSFRTHWEETIGSPYKNQTVTGPGQGQQLD